MTHMIFLVQLFHIVVSHIDENKDGNWSLFGLISVKSNHSTVIITFEPTWNVKSLCNFESVKQNVRGVLQDCKFSSRRGSLRSTSEESFLIRIKLPCRTSAIVSTHLLSDGLQNSCPETKKN